MVVSATANAATNELIVAEAHERHIFLNVGDDPPRCSFYVTSLYRDGDVTVPVSSSGASPSVARWIRRRVQELLPAGLGQVAQTLRAERASLHAAGESTERDCVNACASSLASCERAFQVTTETMNRLVRVWVSPHYVGEFL